MDVARLSRAPVRMLATMATGHPPLLTENDNIRDDDSHLFGCCTAVVISIVMSGFTVVGFIMQKKANKLPSRWTIGDINLSPQWFCGFALGTLVPIPGTILAYCLAPMSLTTPLSGITVAMNMALAPRLLGERLQRWPDFCAAFAILVGTVLTTYAGPRESQDFSANQLQALLYQEVFLRAVLGLFVVQIAGMTYMRRQSKALEAAAHARPANPNMFEVLLPAMVAAGFGSFTNICLKAVGSLAGSGANLLQWLLFLIIAGISGFAQISYVNRGLRLYLQTIFLPVYSAILVLLNTMYGLLFYEEYVYLLREASKCGLFATGIAFIMSGVWLFTLRQPSCPEDDPQFSQEVSLSLGIVAHSAMVEEEEYALS